MSPSDYDLLLQITEDVGLRLWLARETNVGVSRLVVVKQIDPGVLDAAALRAWLSVAQQLHHPALNLITDTEEEEGGRFIVAEWVRGEPLGWLLRQLRAQAAVLEPALALRIIGEVAGGLQSGLELPMPWRHAALGPGCIWVTYEGQIKLSDLDGVTLPLNLEAGGLDDPPQTWMAPEVLAGAPEDARSDVYTLGALLSELLTGRRFEGRVDAAALRESGAPAILPTVLARALAPSPDDRFQEPGQLQRALASAAQEEREASTAGLSAFMARAFPRRQRHWRAIRDAEFRDDDATIASRAALLFGVETQESPDSLPPASVGASYEPHAAAADPVWEPPTQQLSFDDALLRQRLAALSEDTTGLHPHPARALTPKVEEAPATVDLRLPNDLFSQLDAFLQKELPAGDADEVHGDTIVSSSPPSSIPSFTSAPITPPKAAPALVLPPPPEPPPRPMPTERPLELQDSVEPRADITIPAQPITAIPRLPPPPRRRSRAGWWLLGALVLVAAAAGLGFVFQAEVLGWLAALTEGGAASAAP